MTRELVEAANERARGAALHSTSLRFLGSLLVPGDEVVLFEFTALSSEDVVRTSREAELPFDRVAESLRLEPRT